MKKMPARQHSGSLHNHVTRNSMLQCSHTLAKLTSRRFLDFLRYSRSSSAFFQAAFLAPLYIYPLIVFVH